VTETATTTELASQRAKSSRGLYSSGHGAAAARLADGLLSAAAAFDWRLPELFSGESRGPVPYPAACRPQAWSAAAAGARDQLAALLPTQERVLGPEHPDTLNARHNLARWTGQAARGTE